MKKYSDLTMSEMYDIAETGYYHGISQDEDVIDDMRDRCGMNDRDKEERFGFGVIF